MKKYLSLFVLLSIVFIACKKNNNGTTSTSSGPSAISDPSAISSAIKIWHGSNSKGTAPFSLGGGLKLDSTQQNIQSYKGGYAIIHPNIMGGNNIAGYFVHIIGADTYFKVDFSKAAFRPVLAQRPTLGMPKLNKRKGLLFRPTSDSTNNSDSVLVLQLPDNIAPGTFCMEYWAYDYYNNTSNIATVCITVNQLGSSDSSSWTGNWEISSYKYELSCFDYPSYTLDTTWHHNAYDTNNVEYYEIRYCVDGLISLDSVVGVNSELNLIKSYDWFKYDNLTLNANGALLDVSEDVSKYYYSSKGDGYSCDSVSNPACYDRQDLIYSDTGGWSYNASTKKLIIVKKDSSASAEGTYVGEYVVLQKTANSFTIYQPRNGTYVYSKK